jgi:very-short-patch-repair endonuclease
MKPRKIKGIPYNPNLKELAKELRKAGNIHEVNFWLAVKNKQFLGLDFDRQKIIGNYIVDFYCHKHLLIIEIDGGSHNEKQEYDSERDKYFKSLGLHILHFKSDKIELNLNIVLKEIERFIENLLK